MRCGASASKTEEELPGSGCARSATSPNPGATLERALGRPPGAHLRALAWGRDPRSVVPHEPDSSIGAEETFGTDVDDPTVVRRELLRLSERSARRVRRPG